MIKENYNVIGVMSGTSLDGVDIAHVKLNLEDSIWRFEIETALTIPYTEEWVLKLKNAVDYTENELIRINDDYTVMLASYIRQFIQEFVPFGTDAVCSHGHTILHQPENGITLQIGNKPELAKMIGVMTVCDFRVQDVALGGQGAPLVPVGDRLLFSNYDYCVNLGGFSNISFETGKSRTAFDICPVNTVLNHYANQLGFEYDDKGTIAAHGGINYELLEALNGLEYYSRTYPKSLGFEYVKTVILPLMEQFHMSAENKIATFTEHIALQVANVVRGENRGRSLIVTGGGAYNEFLIKRLEELLPGYLITVPDDNIIQYKEALIFALLGVLRLRGEINVLASVTGAERDHSSGCVYNVI